MYNKRKHEKLYLTERNRNDKLEVPVPALQSFYNYIYGTGTVSYRTWYGENGVEHMLALEEVLQDPGYIYTGTWYGENGVEHMLTLEEVLQDPGCIYTGTWYGENGVEHMLALEEVLQDPGCAHRVHVCVH